MTLPARANIVGVRVSITRYEETVCAVMDAARAGRSLLVTAADVHQIMQARRDPTFAAVVNAFDIVTPDGQPVRWGMRWTRQARLTERVYGPTLMLHVAAAARDAAMPVYLYGSRADTLERLRAALVARYPGLLVAGLRAGRFRPLDDAERTEDAAAIRDSGARIVLVGMGCPRQEWWAFHMRERLPMPVLTVGAAFDFHAGIVAQAPPFMQRHGLEWLFRLTREPRRLWRRYLVLNPQYLPLVLAQAAGLRRFQCPTDLRDARARACPG
jgi:N-acetylglucosaminyldiphosphoundecaprenol N-acetyl-beta-D-mannosaminyltransferase